MPELKTFGLLFVTAVAEIIGCYLPYLWLREGKSVWLLIPGALSCLYTRLPPGASTRPTEGSISASP